MLLSTGLLAIAGPASAEVAAKGTAPTDSNSASTLVAGIHGLGPFGISVADLDRSVRFYTALGFKAGERTPLPHSVAKVLGAKTPDATATMQTLGRDGK